MKLVKRAVAAGAVKLLLPNIDMDSLGPMLSAEARYPGICHINGGASSHLCKGRLSRSAEQDSEESLG